MYVFRGVDVLTLRRRHFEYRHMQLSYFGTKRRGNNIQNVDVDF